MKLEFKHIAYIALAVVALYLAYKYLVKGPEVVEKQNTNSVRTGSENGVSQRQTSESESNGNTNSSTRTYGNQSTGTSTNQNGRGSTIGEKDLSHRGSGTGNGTGTVRR